MADWNDAHPNEDMILHTATLLGGTARVIVTRDIELPDHFMVRSFITRTGSAEEEVLLLPTNIFPGPQEAGKWGKGVAERELGSG